jgi:anti-sigma-K factor RskA
MRYDDPTLRDQLAGQYVLGALQGRARTRFERLLRRDAALRRLVHEWEIKLTPLAAGTAAVAPPARVFAAIERRIDGAKAAPTLWERLGFWRAFSAVSAAAVVVLAVTTALLVLRPAAIAPPGYIAVLEDQAAKPVLVVRAYAKPWRLVAEPLGLPPAPPGKTFHVWAVEKGTGTVHGLTEITSSDKPQLVALTEEYWKFIKNADTLVVSIETAGSDPKAPTTPVVFSGLCINLKGV